MSGPNWPTLILFMGTEQLAQGVIVCREHCVGTTEERKRITEVRRKMLRSVASRSSTWSYLCSVCQFSFFHYFANNALSNLGSLGRSPQLQGVLGIDSFHRVCFFNHFNLWCRLKMCAQSR